MNWYIRVDLKPAGPFSEQEMQSRLMAGEISPEDLIWKEGVDEWRAALQWPEFRKLHVPALQEFDIIPEDATEWILLENGPEGPRTTGPWSLQQIRQALGEGRITAQNHLWKKGMSGWARIESRPENLVEQEVLKISSEEPAAPDSIS